MPASSRSRGTNLADRLFQAIREVAVAPLAGGRNLPILEGIDRRGDFTVPQENVLVRAGEILVAGGLVYIYGNSVVMQLGEPTSLDVALVALRSGTKVETSSRGLLANLFVCQRGWTQFPPPKWFIDVLLFAQTVVARLPCVRHYARRPTFDSNFTLLGPGWHREEGILVHGPDVEPIMGDDPNMNLPAIERLPFHLRNLLGGFCFRTDADLVNAVGMLLTGLLVNHFMTEPKAIFPVDGNQSNLGKTWLARASGIVLDGIDPRLIPFTEDEEELHKRLCAMVREFHQSLLIFDNAKTEVGNEIKSPVIESMSMAPEISLRILGKSENITRPNDVLWAFTMNNSRFCNDLITRSCPIRLFYEGKPEDRVFEGENPLRYAAAHRIEILGELIGMVIHWTQAGRPPGRKRHRCETWTQVIGGILESAGLPEFLDNADEVAASFSTELEELAALAEAVIRGAGPYIEHDPINEE